jgi:putative protein kinase ArgK-like GTPase of G3E family
VLFETIDENLKNRFYFQKGVRHLLEQAKKEILSGETTPYIAAQKILVHYT